MAVISYKCPNCDGELVFDPKTQKYKCEYCLSLFAQEELEKSEPETQNAQSQAMDGSKKAAKSSDASADNSFQQTEKEAVVYSCPNCGAQIVTDATTAATFCYYCHNPVVLSERLSGEFLPEQLIPFSITKKEAEQKFLEYVHSKKLVPKAFFDKQQMKHFSGVYFPYWVCDTTIEGKFTADGTKVRVFRRGDTEFTETSFFKIEREGETAFTSMTENALKKNNHLLAKGVLPYRLEEAKPFHFGFLSGFLAEKRDMEQAEVRPIFVQEAKEYGEKLLRETIEGYATVTGKQSNFTTKKEKYAYTLLPVWTLTYPAKNGKTYYYSMNGQTGKICGELPIDYKKLTLFSALAGAAVTLLGLLGGIFLW